MMKFSANAQRIAESRALRHFATDKEVTMSREVSWTDALLAVALAFVIGWCIASL